MSAIVRVLRINTDASVDILHLPAGDPAAFSAAIGGGYFEAVRLTNSDHIMFVDEEGKIKQLAPNTLATSIAHIGGFDVIAGPALVVGPPDRHGNETPVTDAVLAALLGEGSQS